MPSGAELLDDLTPAQREAVMHFEGPLLIIAGAGSGKTRVITRRVAHLLQEGVRPHNILAITFTNKAADEMRQRVEALVPDSRVWISTFHSLGARLLRQYADRVNLDKNFTIYDQNDRHRVVKAALESSGVDNVRFTPGRIEGAISKAKNQLLMPERYAAQANDFFTHTVARVYPYYEKRLRDANAVAFDDLLLIPALPMKHYAELARTGPRFRFVLIDSTRTRIPRGTPLPRLTVEHPNLCVSGSRSIDLQLAARIFAASSISARFPQARHYLGATAARKPSYCPKYLITHNQRKPKDLSTESTGDPVRAYLRNRPGRSRRHRRPDSEVSG